MGFIKYADAIVKSPKLESPKSWNSVRAAASPAIQIVPVTSILADFSPDKYLLTHATIVASVDVESNGYYIKPECSKYINQNGDGWERELLMRTFHSFIGAQNYLEHVQIPHLSKGRIIDAVSRPVNGNESMYIDILVATDRKHRDLVASVETGALTTLSMGCSIKYSFCSRCGNKAADEIQLCNCIRYMKNQFFYDAEGKKRIIAELCGDKVDPESNIFIEASWVANPAFKGAVLRSILNAKSEPELAQKIERAYIARKVDAGSMDGFLKAASTSDISKLEKKLIAVKKARTILSDAGMEEGSEDPFDQPDDEQAQPEQAQPEQAQPEQAQPEQAQPEQAQPEQAQPEQAQPEQAQPEQAQPEQAQPEQAQPEQAAAPTDQPDTIDGVVEQVKKKIREQVIEELTKEMSANQPDYTDTPKTDQDWNGNDSLVQAFVKTYKPLTGYSSAKLGSIFKMICAYENRENFTKYAYNKNDLIDFFQFVDGFQLNAESIEKAHYELLRKASIDNFRNFESFVKYLKDNGISNKAVIKSILTKVSFIRERFVKSD